MMDLLDSLGKILKIGNHEVTSMTSKKFELSQVNRSNSNNVQAINGNSLGIMGSF